ncbi:MAG: ABC transporter permease subunit [Proteobacteria bacterium]|nr:ABC transporter permease subunit [Pseudomonadota bacterium]
MVLSRGTRRKFNAYLLLSPSAATLALVAVFPILYVVYLSFSGFYYGNRTGFVGFRNYVNILSDPNFYSSLKATFIFMVGSVAGQLVLALIFALIINNSRRLESGVRLVAILPYMVSMVAGGVTFRWLLNTEFGLVNSILLSLGVTNQPINFLGEPAYAMASIIGAHLWCSIPLATLILLAGMKSISPDVYESAEIDGAGFFTKFFSITVPLIRPQILVVLLIQTMFSFRHFPLPYAMTGGGPGVSTKVLAMLLQEKMTFLVFGYNSALSVIMMLITLGIAFFYLKLMTVERG